MKKIKELLIKFFKSYLWLILVFFLLDLGTKLWAYYGLQKYDDQTLVIIENFFSFKLQFNNGAAWSMGAGQTELLAAISVICLIGISIYFAKKFKKLNFLSKLSGMLIISGCAGNMIDRIFQHVKGTIYYNKGVIDFLSFKLIGENGYDFPVFNIADSCLVVGVILLLVLMIVEEVKIHKDTKKVLVIKDMLNEILVEDNLNNEDKELINSLISKIDALDLKNIDHLLLQNLINECYDNFPHVKEKMTNDK